MLKTTSTHEQFEKLATEYLALHPEIPHEWREIHDVLGGRTDLICWPNTPNEVFASLTEYQITVGSRQVDKDFETFGRKLTPDELALEAFDLFKSLVVQTVADDA